MIALNSLGSGTSSLVILIIALILQTAFFVAVISIPFMLKRYQKKNESHFIQMEDELNAIHATLQKQDVSIDECAADADAGK